MVEISDIFKKYRYHNVFQAISRQMKEKFKNARKKHVYYFLLPPF